MFWLPIVYSVFYWLFFHVGVGWSIHDEHEAAVVRRAKALYGDLVLKPDEPTILKYMNDENEKEWLMIGKSVFVKDCAQCHKKDGSGINGVNLTDDHYKNVKNLRDIAGVVLGGAANGAMPAWSTRLHPNDVVLVSAYVATMRGQNLKGRPPEGEVIPPWPEYVPEDAAPDAQAPAPEETDGE